MLSVVRILLPPSTSPEGHYPKGKSLTGSSGYHPHFQELPDSKLEGTWAGCLSDPGIRVGNKGLCDLGTVARFLDEYFVNCEAQANVKSGVFGL